MALSTVHSSEVSGLLVIMELSTVHSNDGSGLLVIMALSTVSALTLADCGS